MLRASIDIGSNSVLLLAAEWDNENKKVSKEVLNLSYITSLGKDLDLTKKFRQDTMDATYEALSDYKRQLEKINISPCDVVVTATEASRVATNAADFYKKIKNDLGFSITLITSEGEAYYTALGVASAMGGSSEVVIMDMGGASTELIRVKLEPFKIISTISLPVGSVRATDWKRENIFEEKMKKILSGDIKDYKTKSLLCVAGSMTSLASMYLGLKVFDDKAIDGLDIKFSIFREFVSDLQKTNVDNLLLLFPFLGKRAPMISAGALAAKMIGENLGVEKINISTRGLRYGVLIKGDIDEQFTIR